MRAVWSPIPCRAVWSPIPCSPTPATKHTLPNSLQPWLQSSVEVAIGGCRNHRWLQLFHRSYSSNKQQRWSNTGREREPERLGERELYRLTRLGCAKKSPIFVKPKQSITPIINISEPVITLEALNHSIYRCGVRAANRYPTVRRERERERESFIGSRAKVSHLLYFYLNDSTLS